jgi:metal-dependent amidase/aminoacylase/carboxypeptidase family protein
MHIPRRTGIAGTGLVGHLGKRGSGPVIALRADIDALPVEEPEGLPFRSTHQGNMHGRSSRKI